MNTQTLLLLTNDAEFEKTAQATAEASGYALVVGRKPEDVVLLLGRHLTGLRGAIVDLDVYTHGSAWLGTLSALSPRIPAVAVSRLDARFLQSLAQRHGANYWVSKPVDSEKLSSVTCSVKYVSVPSENFYREYYEPLRLLEQFLGDEIRPI